ncbi:uncharacterized protein LOC135829679 [Sycon ciliatum]|uniref:uncharacterized protein LOC135829679 n=1 Tax=Sycon ciliatum TaxID=27933 RepID=UPI0031F60E9D
MVSLAGKVFLLASVLTISLYQCAAKHEISNERYFKDTNFLFLTRFCFEPGGLLAINVTFPTSECCPKLLFYYNTPDQWSKVRKGNGDSCESRENVAVARNNYISLSPHLYAGCREVMLDGILHIQCAGTTTFRTSWHEWWFIVLSNCDRNTLSLTRHNLTMHNSPGIFTLEFSADEFTILQTDIAFLALYTVIAAQCLMVARVLKMRRILHPSYHLYICSVLCSFIAVMFSTIHYAMFANDGVGFPGLDSAGEFFRFVGFSCFLFLLVLLAKGWTVTRARLTDKSAYRIAITFFVYCIVALIMYTWYAASDTKSEVLYVYASPPGYGLVGVFFIIYAWFCYAVAFSVKNNEDRRRFFKAFWLLYSPWFLVTPIVILISAQVVEDYKRRKIVNGISLAIGAYGHLVFAVLTFPAHFSDFFPYHIRTTQIAAATEEDGAAIVYGAGRKDDDRTAGDYEPSNNMMPMLNRRSLQLKLFVRTDDVAGCDMKMGMEVGDSRDDEQLLSDPSAKTKSVRPAPGDGDLGGLGASQHQKQSASTRNLLQYTRNGVTETGLAEPAVIVNLAIPEAGSVVERTSRVLIDDDEDFGVTENPIMERDGDIAESGIVPGSRSDSSTPSFSGYSATVTDGSRASRSSGYQGDSTEQLRGRGHVKNRTSRSTDKPDGEYGVVAMNTSYSTTETSFTEDPSRRKKKSTGLSHEPLPPIDAESGLASYQSLMQHNSRVAALSLAMEPPTNIHVGQVPAVPAGHKGRKRRKHGESDTESVLPGRAAPRTVGEPEIITPPTRAELLTRPAFAVSRGQTGAGASTGRDSTATGTESGPFSGGFPKPPPSNTPLTGGDVLPPPRGSRMAWSQSSFSGPSVDEPEPDGAVDAGSRNRGGASRKTSYAAKALHSVAAPSTTTTTSTATTTQANAVPVKRKKKFTKKRPQAAVPAAAATGPAGESPAGKAAAKPYSTQPVSTDQSAADGVVKQRDSIFSPR